MKLFVVNARSMAFPIFFVTETEEEAVEAFKKELSDRFYQRLLNDPTYVCNEVTSLEQLIRLAPDKEFKLDSDTGF